MRHHCQNHLPSMRTCAKLLSVMKTSVKVSPIDVDKRAKLDMRAGDIVRVHQKIQEKGKTRIQIFEGLVLARKHGKEAGGTFTVRKVASGVGVEKIFPLYSPNIDKIEVVKRSKVRQSKLYHIRDKAARDVRRQMRNVRSAKEETEEVVAEPVIEEPKAEELAPSEVEETKTEEKE